MKRKQQNDLQNAAEKQRLKQLCIDFQKMIKTEDGARFFVFMMECYNACDVDSFITTVSEAVSSLLEAEAEAEAECQFDCDWYADPEHQDDI